MLEKKFNPEIERPEILLADYFVAREATEILNRNGFEAYIIGGGVRDLLLGKKPKDFDLTTNAKPEEILKLEGFDRSKFSHIV